VANYYKRHEGGYFCPGYAPPGHTPRQGLTGTFIAGPVLQVLSFAGQNEGENIRRWQAEGVTAAKAGGVCFGGKANPLPVRFLQA